MCDHGGLYPIIEKRGEHIPVNIYNQMKEIFFRDWKEKRVMGLYSSEDIPNLTNHEISESNTKLKYLQDNYGTIC